MLTIDDFKEDGQVPLSVYDVTIEQLIMNIMNFYLGLLGGKDEILRMFNSGKAVSKKIWKHVQTDNIDLQKGKIFIHRNKIKNHSYY